jgi:hypothetical protein
MLNPNQTYRLTKVKPRLTKAKLMHNLMWMYFNIGSKEKKPQLFDVDLSLFCDSCAKFEYL